MATLFENDVQPELILGRHVAVIGFGAQGRAHALNLRDAGCDIVVALRPGSPSFASCADLGVAALPLDQALQGADVAMMLVPDETHFLNALRESVETGETQADEMLARFHGPWGGDL